MPVPSVPMLPRHAAREATGVSVRISDWLKPGKRRLESRLIKHRLDIRQCYQHSAVDKIRIHLNGSDLVRDGICFAHDISSFVEGDRLPSSVSLLDSHFEVSSHILA